MHCVVRYTLAVRRIMLTTSPNLVPYVRFLLSLETDALPVSVRRPYTISITGVHRAIRSGVLHRGHSLFFYLFVVDDVNL